MITQNTAVLLPQHTFKCATSLGNINILIDSAFNPWFTMDEFESFFKPITKPLPDGDKIYAEFKNSVEQYAQNIKFNFMIDFRLFRQLYHIAGFPDDIVDKLHNEICSPLFTYIEELKQENQISQSDRFTLDLETIPNKYNINQMQRMFSNIFNSLITLSTMMDNTIKFYQTENEKQKNIINQLQDIKPVRNKNKIRTYTAAHMIDIYRKFGITDNQFMVALKEYGIMDETGAVTQLALDRQYCIIENNTTLLTSKFWNYIRPKLKRLLQTPS